MNNIETLLAAASTIPSYMLGSGLQSFYSSQIEKKTQRKVQAQLTEKRKQENLQRALRGWDDFDDDSEVVYKLIRGGQKRRKNSDYISPRNNFFWL